MAIKDGIRSYSSSEYLVSALDLPLIGQLWSADNGQPYVAVSIDLNPSLLAELVADLPKMRENDVREIGIAINPMNDALSETLLRLLTLLDTPADIPVLAPMIERELMYRLLQGPQGKLLRQIAQPDGALNRVRQAVGWIRDNYRARLRIEALCEASGMSRPTLHRHFLAMTGFSPLQYQKQLRLQEARQLLLAGERNATEVAFAIGYESSSQFSREYLREFGVPPGRDLRQFRHAVQRANSFEAFTAASV